MLSRLEARYRPVTGCRLKRILREPEDPGETANQSEAEDTAAAAVEGNPAQ